MKNKKEQEYFVYFLIFMSTVLGVFLRLKYIDVILPLEDEKATLYFTQNLNTVFDFKSNSPVYYFITRLWSNFFGESIFAYRSLNIFFTFSCSILFLTKYLNKFKWEVIFIYIAWWLNPLSIVADRYAFPYGIYFDLSLLLVFAVNYQNNSQRLTEFFTGILCFLSLAIQPLIGTMITFNLFSNKLSTKDKIIRLGPLIFPIAYYLVRYIRLGKNHLIFNIEWNQNEFYLFLKSLILMFGGDYYPLKNSPISLIWGLSIIILMQFVFYKINDEINVFYKDFFKQLVFIFIIIFLINICGLDLLYNSYYLFLVPMLIVFVSRMIQFHQEKVIYMRLIIFLFGLIIYNFMILQPWKVYESQDKTLLGNIYQIEGSK